MWDWAIWGALIAAAVTGSAATALLAERALSALRDVRDTRRDVVRRLDNLAARAGATADKAAAAGDTAGLRESLGRLRVSLSRLAVLRSAIDEARQEFGRVAAVVPRK